MFSTRHRVSIPALPGNKLDMVNLPAKVSNVTSNFYSCVNQLHAEIKEHAVMILIIM